MDSDAAGSEKRRRGRDRVNPTVSLAAELIADNCELRSDVRSRLAAVDRDRRAADPARARRGEKRDDRSHFVGASEAAERELAFDEVGDHLGLRLLAPMPGPAGKQDRARGHAVDANVVRCKLLRQSLAEADLGGLHRVVGHAAARVAAPKRSDHNDRPAAATPGTRAGEAASAWTSLTASTSRSAPRAHRHTWHPSAPSALALARPNPRLEPVTIAILLVRSRFIRVRLFEGFDVRRVLVR